MVADVHVNRSVGGIPVGLVAALALIIGGCRLGPSSAEDKAGPALSATESDAAGEGESPPISEQQAIVDPPDGMVYVSGGQTIIGSEIGPPEEQPVFKTTVEPFYLDAHPVTVAQFRTFVEQTGFVTEAERFGNSAVFDFDSLQWELREGATWEHPLGPDAPPAVENHPVTHVSWDDASEYARWAGKRLPSEIEWEFAARVGTDADDRYPWGSSINENGLHKANVWQGVFPLYNTEDDGFLLTSPVGTFGTTAIGLQDMAGNVWEWTSDWFRPYGDDRTVFVPTATSERVQRGGSFLCNESYCHGFRVTARGHSTPESSHFHVGFRCARDAITTS